MKFTRLSRNTIVAASAILYLALRINDLTAQQGVPDAISGTVTSARGVEAGIWVIAETTGLPTRYIKEVVTDDKGRYLIPDLPKAHYTVWARGYGLVDSPEVQAEPGSHVDLKPTLAPDAKSAAQY